MKKILGLTLFLLVFQLATVYGWWSVPVEPVLSSTHYKISADVIKNINADLFPDVTSKFGGKIRDWTSGAKDDANAHGGSAVPNGGEIEKLWQEALKQYRAFNFADGNFSAYYYIALMMHLIEDQANAAHAYDIRHGYFNYNMDNMEQMVYGWNYNPITIDPEPATNATSNYQKLTKETQSNTSGPDWRKYWLASWEKGTYFVTVKDVKYFFTGVYGGPINTEPDPDNLDLYLPVDMFPTTWTGAGEAERNLTSALLGKAVGYTAGALMKVSQSLPALIKDLQIIPGGEGDAPPVIDITNGSEITFKIFENRTPFVQVFVTLDSEDGEPIEMENFISGNKFDLEGGSQLPWEGTFSRRWYGKLAGGKYPSYGEHTLYIHVQDEDYAYQKANNIEGIVLQQKVMIPAPPYVVTTSPADSAEKVALDSKIIVTFDHEMDTSSLQSAVTFEPSVSLTVTGGGSSATITPSQKLTAATKYTVTVSDAALDANGAQLDGDKDGEPGGSYKFSFTTRLAPKVTGTDPADGSYNVPVDTKINITFDQEMDAATLESAITITPAVQKTIVCSGKTVTITPSEVLTPKTDYTVTIADSAKDKDGAKLDGDKDDKEGGSYSFTFSTKPAKIKVTSMQADYKEGETNWVKDGSKSVSAQLVDDSGSAILSKTPPKVYWVAKGVKHAITFPSASSPQTEWNGTMNISKGSDGLATFEGDENTPVSGQGITSFMIDTIPPKLDYVPTNSLTKCDCPKSPLAFNFKTTDAGSGVDIVRPVGIGLSADGCYDPGKYQYGASLLSDRVGNIASAVDVLTVTLPSGCDNPDDNFYVGNSLIGQDGSIGDQQEKPFATFKQGYYLNFYRLLDRLKKSGSVADLENFAQTVLGSKKLLIIPSAGLYGFENSQMFKTLLDEFVKQGGTLLVFAQQHGYEYSVIPVPKEVDGTYKKIIGYGWLEDQACFTDAAYITTYHQILSGQRTSTPTLNVDGYFTQYPANSTVLLRRTANGQATLLIYDHGYGKVVLTSMYSDYAYGSNQTSSDELALVRDLISWAIKPAELPEVTPGETVSFSVKAENKASVIASSVKLKILDPDKNVVKEVQVPSSVSSGEFLNIPVTLSTESISPVGIWSVSYELLDSGGNEIQPWTETDSGRFVVSRQFKTGMPDKPLWFSVSTSSQNVLFGAPFDYTFHVFNNTDQIRHLAIKSFFGHTGRNHEWTITANPYSETTVSGSDLFIDETYMYETMSAFLYDEGNQLVGQYQLSFKGFRNSASAIVETNKNSYVKGDNVTINVTVKNTGATALRANTKIHIYDPQNKKIHEAIKEIDLVTYGSIIIPTSLALGPDLTSGVYIIKAEVLETNGVITVASKQFELVRSQLIVTPSMPPAINVGENVFSFTVNNVGVNNVSSGMLAMTIKEPDGTAVYVNSQNFSIAAGQSMALNFSVNLPVLKLGTYLLEFVRSDETRTGKPTTIQLQNSVTMQLALAETSYRIRQTGHVTVTLSNIGKFNLNEGVLTVTAPDLNYTESKLISLAPNQINQWSFFIAIPETAIQGEHIITATFKLPSGSSLTNNIKLTIPDSYLKINYTGQNSVTAGDILNFTVENLGGVDTNYSTQKLSITDSNGIEIYKNTITGSIFSGEKKTFADIQIPFQTVNGFVYCNIQIKDNKTGQLSYLYRPIEVIGITGNIVTKTDKEFYLPTDLITGLTTIANGVFPIESGKLNVKIIKTKSQKTEEFSNFIPRRNWSFNYPSDVAVSSDGFVYVVDESNYRIQKFDQNGNLITKWGSNGDGNDQFKQPYGIAVSPNAFYIYVVDRATAYVKKFDQNGNFIMKWGRYGTTDGSFKYPTDIAVDLSGYVYVADAWNHRIQKFDSNGKFIKAWGTYGSSDGQFNCPSGITTSIDGFVYVVDYYNARIQKFDSDGNFIAKWGTEGSGNGQFKYPWNIAASPDGSFVYVTDGSNNRIQKFDSSGRFITKSIGGFNWPKGITIASDETIYVGDQYNNCVKKLDANCNIIARWGLITGQGDGEFYAPSSVKIGPDGSIYVLDSLNFRVQKFDSKGIFVTKWGSRGTGAGQFDLPEDLAVGPDGSVYVSDIYGRCIHKFDSNGKFIKKWGSKGAGDGQFSSPYAVAVSPDGFVYVTDGDNRRIQKFDSNGNFITKWASDSNARITIGPDGAVFVTNGSNLVQKFDSDMNFIFQFFTVDSTYNGQMHICPYGIAIAPDGAIFVGGVQQAGVYKYDSNGNFIKRWGNFNIYGYGKGGSDEGQFSGPYGIAIDASGTVFVVERGNHRIQKMNIIPCVEETLYSNSLSVNFSSNSRQEFVHNVGMLNITGSLVIKTELKNQFGQIISSSEYPFYIVNDNTVLRYKTDKKVYKPGEIVTITGEVKNLSSANATALVVQLSAGSQSIYNAIVDVPANGSYPFTVSLTTGNEGMYALTGKVTQNTTTLAEVTDVFDVASPKLSVSVSAPEVAGTDAFDITVDLKNEGKITATTQFTIQSSQFTDSKEITIPAGETKRIQYSQTITLNTTYTITLAGDVSQTVSKTVYYGPGARITINSGQTIVSPEGVIAVPVTITNIGLIDETATINYLLGQGSGSTGQETRSYFIAKGGNISDTLYYTLTEGSYQFTASSLSPMASSQAAVTVKKDYKVDMAVSFGAQADGVIPLSVNLKNSGYNSIGCSVACSLIDALGTVAWSSEQDVSLMAPDALQTLTMFMNPSGIAPGVYTSKCEFLDNSRKTIATYSTQYIVQGAKFATILAPAYQTFTAGQEAVFVFKIKNTGNLEGEAHISLKANDFIESVRTAWLKAGEEKEVAFSFPLPVDIESKDYFAEYALKSSGDDWAKTPKSTVKYRVEGIDLAVSADLDKQNYHEGEQARLTLTIASRKPLSSALNLFVRTVYAGYEDKKLVSLSGSGTVTFDIPLPKITGEKLAYGVYHEAGRSIHLNEIYIYKAGDSITITADKQVYNPGETVKLAITGQTGMSGEMTIAADSYTETFAFSGAAIKSFALPPVMTAGTYVINGTLVAGDGKNYSASLPIDVNGIKVKILECNLDKAKYSNIDSMTAKLLISSNTDITGTVKTWMIDPSGTYIPATESSVTLLSAEPSSIEMVVPVTVDSAGVYQLAYSVYAGERILSAGSEAFDVGQAVLLNVTTDKNEYAGANETVKVPVNIFGNGEASVDFLIDGKSVRTETVVLNGLNNLMYEFNAVAPGAHTLQCVVTADGITSVKDVSFIFGSELPNLSVVVSADKVENDTVLINATITNTGKSVSDATTLKLFDGDPASGGSTIASLTVPALNAGASSVVSYRWNILGRSGSHTIYAVVNGENRIAEIDLTNNTALGALSIPGIAAGVSTARTSYKAYEDVGITIKAVNLTTGSVYNDLSVVVDITDVSGNKSQLVQTAIPSLASATTNSTAHIWNTAVNAPGIYSLAVNIMKGQEKLASGNTQFVIDPTPVITGTAALSKETVIQNFPLSISYSLKNAGNTIINGGDLKAELISQSTGSQNGMYSVAFGTMNLQSSIDGNLEVSRVSVSPGDYIIKIKAESAGLVFSIAEKTLKVLPPLEVVKGLSNAPKVLALADACNGNEPVCVGTIIKQALDETGIYYKIADNAQSFKEQMRGGLFNIYVLAGNSNPLTDHLDEELSERVNVGDGVIFMNYGNLTDSKISDLAGVTISGKLPDAERNLAIMETPFMKSGSRTVTGNVQKINVSSGNTITAGIFEDNGRLYPAILISKYGAGKRIFFSFDAEAGLLQNAVEYAKPDMVVTAPGVPVPVEISLKSLGAAFDLIVKEDVGDLPVLLTNPDAVSGNRTLTWQFTLFANELKDLQYSAKLPEASGSYSVATSVFFKQEGAYELYSTFDVTLDNAGGLDALITAILDNLKNLAVSEKDKTLLSKITADYQMVIGTVALNKQGMEKKIQDLLAVIGDLKGLSVDTTMTRFDLGRLLRAFERKWLEMQ